MKGAKQTTLRHQVAVSGIGVHSGLPVTLTLHPADDDSGIVFQRVAPDGSIEREIRADVRAVTATEFATEGVGDEPRSTRGLAVLPSAVAVNAAVNCWVCEGPRVALGGIMLLVFSG